MHQTEAGAHAVPTHNAATLAVTDIPHEAGVASECGRFDPAYRSFPDRVFTGKTLTMY